MSFWLTVACLLGAGAAAMYWLAAADARDLARRLAFELCAQSGVQLLDQSVVLRAVRPVRRPAGLRLCWRYQFDYSGDGVSRQRGELTVVDGELESAVLAAPRA
jgi:hypothetical protein